MKTFFCRRPLDHATKRGKCLHGMLCIVVVPWDVVEIQEREHRVTILLQAIDELARGFARAEPVGETLVKPIHGNPMLSEKTFLEAAPVHRLHHRLHQAGEIPDEPLEQLIIRLLQQFVVQISDEMNQAFLLGTFDTIIRGVEIR